MNTLALTLSDGVTIARRNVIKIRRVPQTLVAVLVSPLLMVVMFHYIFGSSIEIPGVSYDGYLISGAFAMILVFGSTFTGAGLADDLQKGIIDRFRSLPMSRSAVIVGRTVTDVIYNLLSLMVMALAGLAVGWRINGGLDDAVLAFVLLLAFAYAFSWIMAYVGLVVPSVEVVNNAATMVIFPLTFISNAFVPAENLVTPLRIFAQWNPISAVTQASRELFGNVPAIAGEPTAWSLQHPVAYTLLWTILIIAIFAPLSIRASAGAEASLASGLSRADARPTITASANAPQTWNMGYSPDHHQPDKPALSGACALRHNGRDPTRPLTILGLLMKRTSHKFGRVPPAPQNNASTSTKPAGHYFHAARSFLDAKTTDLMARPAPPPPGHGSLVTILAGVSSWVDPIRRRCERGNDPHQREEYA